MSLRRLSWFPIYCLLPSSSKRDEAGDLVCPTRGEVPQSSKSMNRNLRFLVVGMLVAYSTLLLFGTLYPFDFRLDARSLSYFPSPEWIPFTYHDPRCPWTGFFKDKLINIVMFLPFGALLGIIIQSGVIPEGTFLKTIVLPALFSLAIETLQYFLPQRHPAASDLLMNTLGAFFGAWLVTRGLAVFSLRLSRSS